MTSIIAFIAICIIPMTVLFTWLFIVPVLNEKEPDIFSSK